MSLVNKEVMHETFGKGNVLKYNDSYIRINFSSGEKKFIFPDAFSKYIRFIDKRPAELVRKKIQQKEEARKQAALALKKQRAFEQEQRDILKQMESMKNKKIHPTIQSVFWCDEQEENEIFTEWRIFTGKIKSGKDKGQIKRLIRMNQNSACLITKRKSNEAEKERRIIGLFMAEELFNGRLCEDGYIKAHKEYRIQLSEKESKSMLFWNYYIDGRFPDRMTWNSGRQRYFDNIWMAQILQGIVSLKEKPHEREEALKFYEYFCRMNQINQNKLPKASGPLMQI